MVRPVYDRADVVALLAEVFRELGYDGASMGRITGRTGLGKSSLYHFFPGGKEEMAAAVLADIDAWFDTHVYRPLREDEPHEALERMWHSIVAYFQSGRRICLVGAFALDETRDRFTAAIAGYFGRWVEGMAGALTRTGRTPAEAASLAETIVSGIQGALVLSRALNDPSVFTRGVQRLRLMTIPERSH